MLSGVARVWSRRAGGDYEAAFAEARAVLIDTCRAESSPLFASLVFFIIRAWY